MTILYVLSVVIAGVFGAAVLRLLWEQPRDVCFILAGVMFLCSGMKKSPFARKVLMAIRTTKP